MGSPDSMCNIIVAQLEAQLRVICTWYHKICNLVSKISQYVNWYLKDHKMYTQINMLTPDTKMYYK